MVYEVTSRVASRNGAAGLLDGVFMAI
jgi:hypothetical protein